MVINPRPEGYGSCFVCHSFTHSLILSSGTAFTSTPQLRHERDRHMKIFRFDSWILLKRWRSRVMTGIIKWLGVTKQDGGKLNGHHSEPAITRERQRFSKIHESNRNIFMWRSRSCLSCGVEVNAVPDDRMSE